MYPHPHLQSSPSPQSPPPSPPPPQSPLSPSLSPTVPPSPSPLDQQSLLHQLKQYKFGIQQCMSNLISISKYHRSGGITCNQKEIYLMIQKMEFQITKYQHMIHKVESKVVNKGGVYYVRGFLQENYSRIVRECHQLISMAGNVEKVPTQHDFRKIKQFQQQMDEQWRNLNQRQTPPSLLLQPETPVPPAQLLLVAAASQLQQQFLTIRLLAYKMYQKHNGHQHQKIHSQIELLAEEQNKLKKQVQDMKNVRMGLIEQEAKITQHLIQVRKINQLIGRRYFVQPPVSNWDDLL